MIPILKKYWVVRCPKWTKARGVMYPQSSVLCFKCGKTHKVKNLRIWAKYFTLDEMKEGIAKIQEGNYD